MVYKNFRTICIVRVLLLSSTICLFFYLLFYTRLHATFAIVGMAIIYQIIALIFFVENSNRNLIKFLQSIKYSDFSVGFSRSMRGKTFNELSAAFSNVTARFREISAEKEESYRYLQTVVQHVGVGMIAFQKNGDVELFNAAAKRLFDLSHMKNIDALASINPTMLEKLHSIQPGQRSLVKINIKDELVQLSIYATELRLRHKRITLVSFQNISSELNEKEMEAWQNLIRVLTHEIKNSLTPIASLASSIEEILISGKEERDATAAEGIDDIRDALQTIQKRSHGLLQFVDAYRNLTHIPKPDYQLFPLSELFNRVEKLIFPQIEEKNVMLQSSIAPENLELTADPQLIEQVLINLLLNAIEATAGQVEPMIDMHARIDDRGRAVIKVSDNGPGIIADALEKIFVPFFSTKKGGSGIGLSLSRQIMRFHRGDLTVQSVPNEKTTFTMRF